MSSADVNAGMSTMTTTLSLLGCVLVVACSSPAIHHQSSAQPVDSALNHSKPDARSTPHHATAMIVSTTVYYVNGPQQAHPPEGELVAGTPVRILDDNGSYLLVTTMDGRRGWVSTGSINSTPRSTKSKKTKAQ